MSLNRLSYIGTRLSEGFSSPVEGASYLADAVVGNLRIRLGDYHVSPSSSTVHEDSWDVLIVLDACRYDSFVEQNPFEAPCQRRVSQAPNTRPWFLKNFVWVPSGAVSDIVYVTANPKTAEALDDENRFYRFDRVFESHWDSSVDSVLPEELTDVALDRAERFPDKRLVVHYLQPHGPFVGADQPSLHMYQYQQLRRGEVSIEAVLEAYRTSLSRVLTEVKRLVDGVSGDVVVTADHGESFGEAGIYGHPPWANSDRLLYVPWVELEGAGNPPRYETQALESHRDVTTTTEEQLESLGYH